MKLTTKQIVTIMTALAAFDLAIGTGQIKVTANMIPAAYIDAVKDWATFLAIVLSGGASVVNAMSEASAQTKSAVTAAIVALFLVFAPGEAHAQPKLPQFRAPQITGNVVKDTQANNAALMADIQSKLGSLPDIQSKLDALTAKLPQITGNPIKDTAANNASFDDALAALDMILQPDIDAAVKAADGAGNFNAKNCMDAISRLVKANAAANAAAADLSAAPATASAPNSSADIASQLPIKNFFTRLVQLSNLMLAAQAGSPSQQQCSAFQAQFSASPLGTSILGSSVFAKFKPILTVLGLGL